MLEDVNVNSLAAVGFSNVVQQLERRLVSQRYFNESYFRVTHLHEDIINTSTILKCAA
jgi:hypothetical protein